MNQENTFPPSMTTLGIRCPQALIDRVLNKMADVGLPNKTAAVIAALEFWLEVGNAPASTSVDDYTLLQLKYLVNNLKSVPTAETKPEPEPPKPKPVTPKPEPTPPTAPEFKRGTHISIGEFAQIYFTSFKLGRNQMFALLRSMGIIQKDSTLPVQKYLKSGMFEVITASKDGKTYPQAVLTAKGQTWLPEQVQNHLQSLKP